MIDGNVHDEDHAFGDDDNSNDDDICGTGGGVLLESRIRGGHRGRSFLRQRSHDASACGLRKVSTF